MSKVTFADMVQESKISFNGDIEQMKAEMIELINRIGHGIDEDKGWILLTAAYEAWHSAIPNDNRIERFIQALKEIGV